MSSRVWENPTSSWMRRALYRRISALSAHSARSNKTLLILFLIKPTDTLIFQIYFCQETLRVSGSSSARNMQSFFTKINLGNQCVCWFYLKDICYDARSHERKICSHSDGWPNWDSTLVIFRLQYISLGFRWLIIVHSQKFGFLPLLSEVHFLFHIYIFYLFLLKCEIYEKQTASKAYGSFFLACFIEIFFSLINT